MKKITIAIDGYSSCGKSTMAKDLAREIGYIILIAVPCIVLLHYIACRKGSLRKEASTPKR